MSVSFLTQEGYDELQSELDYLRTIKRKEVAQRLHEAMEGGELIENAEYEAAKNEQAFTEGRIKELEYLLATARVVTEAHKSDCIQVGSRVTVVEDGLDEEEIYTIVGAAEAKPSVGKISNESPLGKALLNHKAGDKVSVNAPAGAYKVKIIKFE
ncbi:MAG: transcription elongation factor GreA [Anaerolineaceae bacterium]|jgi:transcription elongation factor GreA|nr:transcription elongation factor GreA [Anaerolineaceae bacterium]